MKLTVNDADVEVDDRHARTPLLWVLRDVLGMHGTKFGCGVGYCAACTVLLDGKNTKSCQTATERAVGKSIVTVEGASGPVVDAVRDAWYRGNVVQCGYCQPGQMLAAIALLESNPAPDAATIAMWMNGNLCRWGTYPRINEAVRVAAETLASGVHPQPLTARPEPDLAPLSPEELADPVRPYIQIRPDGTVLVFSSQLEIVAVARHPGVLTKVAVRRRAGVRVTARATSLVLGLGADYVRQVSTELGGEQIHVVQWQGDPGRYVAGALGLKYLPPIEISPSTRLANVLLGDIDFRGMRGRQGINLLLASALTGWRIRLREIARVPAWKTLERARDENRSVPAVVQSRVPKGLALVVHGLNAMLPIGQLAGVRRKTSAEHVDALLRERLGRDIQVNVLRLDPDEGHIIVAERAPGARQLRLL